MAKKSTKYIPLYKVKKFDNGGYMSPEDIQNQQQAGMQTNQAIDSIGNKVPVYGQIYGAAKMGEGIGKSLVPKRADGTYANNDKAALDIMTPAHEAGINDFQKGNVGAGLLDFAGIGALGKAYYDSQGKSSQLFGVDNTKKLNPNATQNTGANQGIQSNYMAMGGQIKKYLSGGPTRDLNEQRLTGDRKEEKDLEYSGSPYNNSQNISGMRDITKDDANPNAQLEKKEVFQNPDGTTQQVNAPTHANGGINLNLENGTRIYSDRLKSSNGKTFAKEAEVYKTDKFEKILSNDKADSLKKKTAQLMLEKNKRALDTLFQEQESQKDENFGQDLFAFGGVMKYKDGGIHIAPENKGKFTAAAKKAGQSVQEYASKILAHKENYSSTLVKRANFAHNASKWKHGDGGTIDYPAYQGKLSYANGGQLDANRLPSYFQDGGLYMTDGEMTDTRSDRNYKFAGGGVKQAFLDRAMDGRIKVAYFADGGVKKYWDGGNSVAERFAQPMMLNNDPTAAEHYYNQPGFNFQATPGGNNQTMNGPITSDTMKPGNAGTYSDNTFDFQNNPGGANPPQLTNGPINPNYNPNTEATPFGQTPNQSWWNRNQGTIGNIGKEMGIGAISNAGNLAYLADQGKRYDKQQFYGYNPQKLDPTNALRDVDTSTSALRRTIPGTSGGSGSLAVSGLLANKLQGDTSKADIRAKYDEANTGIGNEAQRYNIGNKYRTDDINAANKGQALTNYYSALGQVGRNTGQQLRDNQVYQDSKTIDTTKMNTLNDLYSNYQYDQKSGHWIPKTR